MGCLVMLGYQKKNPYFANKKVVILPPMIANLCRSTTFVAKTKTFVGDVPITKISVDGVIPTRIVITTEGRLVLLVFVKNVHLTNARNVKKKKSATNKKKSCKGKN